MELSDYITNNMSTEPTKDFLRMQGKELNRYKPVNLYGEGLFSKDKAVDNLLLDAMRNMAQQARDLGCEYVTNIRPAGTINPTVALGFLRTATSPGALYLTGTGLVPKNQ